MCTDCVLLRKDGRASGRSLRNGIPTALILTVQTASSISLENKGDSNEVASAVLQGVWPRFIAEEYCS